MRRMATWNLMELEKIRCRIYGIWHQVSGQCRPRLSRTIQLRNLSEQGKYRRLPAGSRRDGGDTLLCGDFLGKGAPPCAPTDAPRMPNALATRQMKFQLRIVTVPASPSTVIR